MTRIGIATAILLAASASTPALAQTPIPRPQPVVQQPLSPNGVRAVQRELRSSGFYRGAVDGHWGRGTEAALGAYQESRGLKATWQLDPATVRALGLDPQQLAASSAASAQPPGTPPGQVLPRDVVRRIQERLARAGFSPGRADGVWGDSTEAALHNFQEARGLKVTGDLNPITAQALGMNPANLNAEVAQTPGNAGNQPGYDGNVH